ncbi:MAG: ComEC/Rec2 family competence protein [Flavobacteriales bacterium]
MNFWNNNPGIRLVIPFILGIIISIELEISSFVVFYLGLFLLLIFGVSFKFSSFKSRRILGLIISLSIVCFGVFYTTARTQKFSFHHFSKAVNETSFLKVRISENLIEKENSYKTLCEVVQVNTDNSESVSGKFLAYFKKDSLLDLKYGDEIIIKNKLREIEEKRNPNQFDYKNYLNLNQINYQVFLDTSDWVHTGSNTANHIIAFSQKMRKKLYNYLKENGVVDDQLKVASALLLGYRENLDKDLVKSYSSAGAMHVLAVSGLHVGILYILLSRLLNFFKGLRKRKYLVALILISFLWFYALMTGLSASVMRASTMFSFIIIGDKLLNRSTSIYNTLAISAIILLVINPFMIYQVGFQLSYAAVIGIVYLQPKLNRLFFFKNIILKNIWAITCVSIAAQIATFPLSLHYFHQFPVYFFVSNLIVIPSAILIFYLGIALFVTAPFGGLSLVIGKLMNGIIWVLNHAIFITQDIPYSLIEEIELSIFETYLLYGIIISFLVTLYYRKIKFVYLSFSLLVLFVGLNLVSQYNSTQQEYFTFYSINKKTALEYTKGKTTYFISNKELQEDWSMMLFNVNNHWNTHNITKKVFFNSDSLPDKFSDDNLLINTRLVVSSIGSIWFFNSQIQPLVEPDYVWISNKTLKGLSRYLKKNSPKKLVFDSSIPSYKQDYYLPYIDTSKTEVIELQSGSFKIKY